MPTVRTYWQAVAWCAAVLLTWTLCSPAAAQNRSSASANSASSESTERFANPFASLQAAAPALSSPLEGAVDPETYPVGPGDVFSVYIGGSQPVTLRQAVSADGRLVLPEVPGLPVEGLSLARVQADAIAALRERFRNVTLDVALAQPRQFYVHVVGAVPVAGRVVATPVTRVSTTLYRAFADSAAAMLHPAYKPSLRNVTVRHRDGTTQSIDLRHYLATGDTRHNPYLRDGDVISVPSYHVDKDVVYVDGDVPFPGKYPYRPTDTVLDLLTLARVDEPTSGVRAVRLVRPDGRGGRETQVFDVQQILDGETAAPPLRPLDHLYVISSGEPRSTVTVAGAVNFPGAYPIQDGVTTLQDLLQLVEVLPDALVRGAYLERSPQPGDELSNQGQLVPPDHIDSADSTRLFRNVRLADFDFTSRSYFAEEMRLQNRVSVDLEAVVAGTAEPVALRAGDRLVIPWDEQTVYVFGHVNRPGLVTVQDGWGTSDYIRAAGGRGPLAAEAHLIEAGTGRYLPIEGTSIRSGDMIFVNRQNDIALSASMHRIMLDDARFEMEKVRDRREARYRTIGTVLTTVGTLTSIVTTYLLLRERL